MPKGRRDPNETREAVFLVIGCGVFVVWAVSQLAATFFGRPIDGAVHGIMLSVVTAFISGAYLSGRRANGNGNGRAKEDNASGDS